MLKRCTYFSQYIKSSGSFKILQESKLEHDYDWWGLLNKLIPSLATISKLLKQNKQKTSCKEQNWHLTIFLKD